MPLPKRLRLALCLAVLAVPGTGAAQPATPVLPQLWKVTLRGQETYSSPAIAPDGTIYQGTFTGQLLAVTPAGQVKWIFQAGREILSSPAVADDGTIYFGARDRKLYAVAPDGKLKWTFPTGAWVDSSPAIATDGTVYFGSWDGKFYAVNGNGTPKLGLKLIALAASAVAILGVAIDFLGRIALRAVGIGP